MCSYVSDTPDRVAATAERARATNFYPVPVHCGPLATGNGEIYESTDNLSPGLHVSLIIFRLLDFGECVCVPLCS